MKVVRMPLLLAKDVYTVGSPAAYLLLPIFYYLHTTLCFLEEKLHRLGLQRQKFQQNIHLRSCSLHLECLNMEDHVKCEI